MSPFLFLLENLATAPLLSESETFFSLALSSARRGLGRTWPNPAVGCVIVKDGVVVAEGRTQDSGRPHAETVVLKKAGALAAGATMYVTLEPCSHTGLTAPCAEAIVAAGIKHLIYGCEDPDQRVNGRGLAFLRQHGITVEQIANIELQRASLAQIAAFSCAKKGGRPMVVGKLAISADGKIAAGTGMQTKITGDESQKLVHALRSHVDAVMVGSKTVLVDNPELTVRLGTFSGNPWKIVIDSGLKTNPQAAVYGALSMVVHADSAPQARKELFDRFEIKRIETREIGGLVDVAQALQNLATLGLTSILLEGGARLLNSFRRLNLIDEFWLFTGPAIIGHQGVPAWPSPLVAPTFQPFSQSVQIGQDYLIVGKLEKDAGRS